MSEQQSELTPTAHAPAVPINTIHGTSPFRTFQGNALKAQDCCLAIVSRIPADAPSEAHSKIRAMALDVLGRLDKLSRQCVSSARKEEGIGR
jgi:hypothetical protein